MLNHVPLTFDSLVDALFLVSYLKPVFLKSVIYPLPRHINYLAVFLVECTANTWSITSIKACISHFRLSPCIS